MGLLEETVMMEGMLLLNRILVVDLEALWQQQYRMDFPECSHDEQTGLSREDQRFMELVTQSTKPVDGHYQAALPLRKSKLNMPNNRKVAEQRALNLQRRFKRDLSLLQQYSNFMNDMISKGYAEKVPTAELERIDGRLRYSISPIMAFTTLIKRRLGWYLSVEQVIRELLSMPSFCKDQILQAPSFLY